VNWLSWKKGRQRADYYKMLLFGSATFPVDVYLLSYPEGAELPEHVDPVPGYKHFRLNIVLRKPRWGGHFRCETAIWNTRRIKLFRSDRPHSMTRIEWGRRLVLSIGWVIREEDATDDS
jgi:hypothetical protein